MKHLPLAGALALSGISLLGVSATTSRSYAAEVPAVNGTIGASYNSHFVSYGGDVWGGGEEIFGRQSTTFVHAHFDLVFDVLTLNLGVRADVNDNASSRIGSDIQEIDVYAGAEFTTGMLTVGAMYQQWYYLSDKEQVVDIHAILNDVPLWGFQLRPRVHWHMRVAENGPQKEGHVVVASVTPGKSIGSSGVFLSFPAGAGFFLTKFYKGGPETGYAYSYFGAAVSIPLKFVPDNYGALAINVAVTYYATERGALPFNVAGDFPTASVGISYYF